MTDDPTTMTLLVIGMFFTIFPAFWCAIVFLLSFVGGWRTLAQKYATDREPKGKAFRWVTGMMGAVSYKNVLKVHVAPEGLYLAMPFFFRIGHPPLLIPWHAIHSHQQTTFLWVRAVKFEVGTPKIASLRLPAEVLETAPTSR